MTKIELEKKILELQLEIERKNLAFAEGNLKKKEQTIWRNPLFLGVIAASIGFLGNVITTQLQAFSQTQIKEKEFQSSLIIEAIKTGDIELAKKNLQFFVDAGFIEDYTGNLSEIIDKATPILPNNSGKYSKTEWSLANAIGKVIISDGDNELMWLSGILLENNVLMTVIFNPLKTSQKIQVEFGNNLGGVSSKKFNVGSSPIETIKLEAGLSINLFKIYGNPASEFYSFRIKSTEPIVGGILRQLEKPNSQLMSFSDCMITNVQENEFNHNCPTGPGSAGNILIDDRDNVIGIHYANVGENGIAIRFDKVVKMSKTLKKIVE